MGVHVDELHTDVVAPSPSASSGGAASSEAKPLGAAEQAWREQWQCVQTRRERVAAEAFDD